MNVQKTCNGREAVTRLLRALRSGDVRTVDAGSFRHPGESPEALRARVLEAIAMLAYEGGEPTPRARRRRLAIERYDLAGDRRELVARSLGISVRQFYNERRRALALLEASLAASGAEGDACVLPAPGLDVRLASAEALFESNAPGRAVDELVRALHDAVEPCARLEIVVRLSALLAQAGRASDTRRALAEARRIVRTVPARVAAETPARLFVAETLLALALDDVECADRAFARAHTAAGSPRAATDRGWRVLLPALVGFAERRLQRGRPGDAAELARDIECALANASDLPVAQRTRAQACLGLLYARFPERLEQSRRLIRGAYRLALDNGLARTVMYPLVGLIGDAVVRDDNRAVFESALALHGIAREREERSLEFGAMLYLAYAEAALGRPDVAQARFASCRSAFVLGAREHRALALFEATSHRRSGRFAEAARVADRLLPALGGIGFEEARGAVLTTRALSRAALGRTRDALADLDEALPLTERVPSPYHSALGYQCAHAMTGRERYREAGVALWRTLRPSGPAEALDAPPLPKPAVDVAPGGLTDRQRDVARLVREGATNREIAARLGISEHTAAHHVRAILARLNVSARRYV